MFFGKGDFTVRVLSVHLLSWSSREVEIPPKKSFALSYRMAGDARFDMSGALTEASDGDILYFPKGIGYHLDAGRERLYGINFETDIDMPAEILRWPAKKRPFFESAFSEMYRVWVGRESGYYARATSYFYRIISEIVREGEEESRDASYLKLKPALSLIYSGYMDPGLSVSSLAEHIGVSDTYFRRIFERCMGERPLEFINGVRIGHAAEHLASGFYNVESVAEMCGFSDAKYFSTVFKRIKGMSPTEYVRNYT